MKMILVWIISLMVVFMGGYVYGISRTETKIIEKKVEVVKYVAQKRAKIQALPNADRDELLLLMRSGRL